MTEHFNKLTPAEAERLAMLAEEAGEIIQIVGKILRHGYESNHPENPDWTNRDLLGKEVTDLVAIVQMMEPDFNVHTDDYIDQTVQRKLNWTHHQSN